MKYFPKITGYQLAPALALSISVSLLIVLPALSGKTVVFGDATKDRFFINRSYQGTNRTLRVNDWLSNSLTVSIRRPLTVPWYRPLRPSDNRSKKEENPVQFPPELVPESWLQ